MAFQSILRASCLVTLGAGVFSLPFVAIPSRPGAGGAVADGGATAQMLAPGDSAVVDIAGLLPHLDRLRMEERREQIADWAVYGSLVHGSRSSAEIRTSVYDKLPVREPGLEEAANYDYGPGRRLILGDSTVWLFYSAADTQRTATLGRLADQVRMELGEWPLRVGVFRFRAVVPDGTITIYREEDVPGEKLFSPEYGYIQRTVHSPEELDGFLKAADDVTHVRLLDAGGVELGGRRFAGTRTAGVTLEDVATLYRAHQAIARGEAPPNVVAPGFSLDHKWNTAGTLTDIRAILDNPEQLIATARALASTASVHADGSPVASAANAAEYVHESFPGGDDSTETAPWRDELLRITDALEAQGTKITEPEVLVPFHALKNSLEATLESLADTPEASTPEIVNAARLYLLLNYVESRNVFQCARYDGPLQGTRVGMILYYTDMLAKLWAMEFAGSAPLDEVFGFTTHVSTGATVEPAFWAEMDELPYVRLWFGTKEDGYSSLSDHRELAFAHIATRVFSKGSNPLRPRDESETAEGFKRAMRWWDRHYAEVADYEQAYHVQNQVMKWSVITGWLVEGGVLAEVGSVRVNDSYRFDNWYPLQESLRFRLPLRFVQRELWPNNGECIERFVSRTFVMGGEKDFTVQGGVTLGSFKSVTSGTRIAENVAPAVRRAGLRYERSTGDRLVSLREVSYDLPTPMRGGVADVVTTPKTGSALRISGTDVRTSRLTTSIGVERRGGRISIGFDGAEFGRMSVVRGARGPQFRWSEGVAEHDAALLRSVALRRDLVMEVEAAAGKTPHAPADVVAAADEILPSRNAFVVEGENGVEVLFAAPRGGSLQPHALRITTSEDFFAAYTLEPSISTAGRVSGNRLTAYRPEPRQVERLLDEARWQRLNPLDGEAEVARVFTQAGPTGGTPIRIATGQPELPSVNGVVTEGRLYLERPADSGARGIFRRFVTEHDLSSPRVRTILEEVEAGARTIRLDAPGMRRPPSAVIADHIARGDMDAALSALDQAARNGSLDDAVAGLREQVSSLGFGRYAQGQPSQAARLFAHADPARATPDELLYKTLVQLEEQDVSGATRTLRAIADGGRLPDAARDALSRQFRRTGAGEVDDFLWTIQEGAPRPALRLEFHGSRIHSVLHAGDDVPRTVLSQAERRAVAPEVQSGRAQVYLEDGLLGKLDFEPEFGRSVSRVAADPHLVWERIDVGPLSAAPSRLLLNGERFTRTTTLRVLQTTRYFYVVRRCPSEDHERGDTGCRAA